MFHTLRSWIKALNQHVWLLNRLVKETLDLNKFDLFWKDYDQIFNNFHTNPPINSVGILEFLVKTCAFVISGLIWVKMGRQSDFLPEKLVEFDFFWIFSHRNKYWSCKCRYASLSLNLPKFCMLDMGKWY